MGFSILILLSRYKHSQFAINAKNAVPTSVDNWAAAQYR